MLEVDSREEARNVIPPIFQAQSKIIKLNTFTMAELEHMLMRRGT